MILTPSHLAIVMEYASGGELYERICNAGRFSEDEVKHSDITLYTIVLLTSSQEPIDLLRFFHP